MKPGTAPSSLVTTGTLILALVGCDAAGDGTPGAAPPEPAAEAAPEPRVVARVPATAMDLRAALTGAFGPS